MAKLRSASGGFARRIRAGASRVRALARSWLGPVTEAGRDLAPRIGSGLGTVARRGVKVAPEWGVLLLAATVVAGLLVTLQLTLTGDTASRTLWAAIAAASVPLIVILAGEFGTLFKRVGGREPERGHLIALTVLALVLSTLGFYKADWLPGLLARCYTAPGTVGMTVFVQGTDGVCYGLIDTADTGPLGPATFGGNQVAAALQRRILEQNRPLQPGDLTAIWLGSLSCTPAAADPTQCADGRDYPAERDQLRGLFLAQQQIARTTGHRLHVVIADAGQDVSHVDDVARLVVANRAAFGGRLVVIGGGDSRDVTQRAINRLLDDGVPFIAPNLLADLAAPGRPFVDRPGYLQLSAPNQAYAADAVARISARYPAGFRLAVFQLPAPTDQYTTSLVNDLLAAVGRLPGHGTRGLVRQVRSLDQLDSSICTSDRQDPPTVVFFADRWGTFDAFAHRVNDVCGYSAPQQVVADASVSRYMASNALRAGSNATWPVDYYVGGLRCSDLQPTAMFGLVASLQPRGGPFSCASDSAPGAYCTLDAAESVSQPCVPNDVGTFVAPAWDAALLADALLPPRTQVPTAAGPLAAYLAGLHHDPLELSEGAATVRGGRLVARPGAGPVAAPTIPIQVLHVDHLDDPAERPRATSGA
jgi:hypothetical protein